jgi:hypothetical protein
MQLPMQPAKALNKPNFPNRLRITSLCLVLTSVFMTSNLHFSKEDSGSSNALVDVPSELKPLKLCIFKRLQLSAVNSHCAHMRSRHSELVAKDEENETTLAGPRLLNIRTICPKRDLALQVIATTSKAPNTRLQASA